MELQCRKTWILKRRIGNKCEIYNTQDVREGDAWSGEKGKEDGVLKLKTVKMAAFAECSSALSSVNSTAQLSDSGNLILRDESNGNIIWESFDHPSDSMLQEMKISINRFTDKETQLTSWKGPTDPSTRKFTSGINPLNIPEIYIWNGSHPYWHSGPWNGQSFIGIPAMVSCERNNTGGGKGKEDGFLKLKTVEVSALAELVFAAEDNCKSQCLNNCSCIAYA
ncbi:G-type lectin S-receptor-like serine/threonine-protein kinase At1g11330 [Cornus florida]|uniref:G-type lectin S-receptor-like serine/threonine-protein kinase At1g11330 n=1 Tax=Cornus florida TaxID=4283 RepID=UPI00289EC797|nr:G-type lectin S-receptor-like serine/threonine-protein kinase At1g11330 [Cornus florida]